MYVTIGGIVYRNISNIKFDPETDVTGSSVPINELWVDVHDVDEAHTSIGDWVKLIAEDGTVWCSYDLKSADRLYANVFRVHAASQIGVLDTVTLPPRMYTTQTAKQAMEELLLLGSRSPRIDSVFETIPVRGYVPKQTARVRLQWICMVAGAYVQDCFSEQPRVKAMDDTEVGTIPVSDTYWRPTVTRNQYVTGVRATYYSYTEGMPSRTDEYVEVGGTTYIQTSQQLSLANPDVPSGVGENVVEVDGVTLVTEDNVDDLLSFLAKYHFARTEIDLTCIDNGQWQVGQRVFCFADVGEMYSGYIVSTDFAFGAQSRAKIHLMPTEARGSAGLVIVYSWEGKAVGRREYTLPVGVDYELDNQYIDLFVTGHRYVFRPLNAKVTGRLTYAGEVVTEPVELALDERSGDLYVRSVDKVTSVDGTAVIS